MGTGTAWTWSRPGALKTDRPSPLSAAEWTPSRGRGSAPIPPRVSDVKSGRVAPCQWHLAVPLAATIGLRAQGAFKLRFPALPGPRQNRDALLPVHFSGTLGFIRRSFGQSRQRYSTTDSAAPPGEGGYHARSLRNCFVQVVRSQPLRSSHKRAKAFEGS
jgi:hypothetical protein